MALSLGLGPTSPRKPGRRGVTGPLAEGWPGDERAALRFAAGEPGSLALLVGRFAEGLFPLAARLAGVERGEALLEEAFLRALAARERYRGEPPLEEWLTGLVEESARARPRRYPGSAVPAGAGRDLAPPFALASRLVSRLEERQLGPGAALRRAGFLGQKMRVFAIVAFVAVVAFVVWDRKPEPPPSEGDGAVPVFFDSSSVIREAVTPPGKIPIVTLHPSRGDTPGWRLASPAVQARIPSALTALFRLDLDGSGRVKGVKKLFSVPSVPPAGVEQLLENLIFEPIAGMPQAAAIEVRIVAE